LFEEAQFSNGEHRDNWSIFLCPYSDYPRDLID